MPDPAAVLTRINALRDLALRFEHDQAASIALVPPATRDSARNLVHYLALRQEDLRPLQHELGRLGLSRLAQAESATLATVQAVAAALRALAGVERETLPAPPIADAEAGSALLEANTAALFGPRPVDRHARIMVTIPTEAATHPTLMRALVAGGMDIARINCAHDEPATWLAMIGRLRTASAESGRPCRIHADLAGPKLRTGPTVDRELPVSQGERVLVTVAPEPGIPSGPGGPARISCTIPEVLARVKPGDAIWFDDGRVGGHVLSTSTMGIEVELDQVRPGGDRLKAGKGINLPQTDLGLAALTVEDREALTVLAPQLDLVGLSFVRRAEDVAELDHALAAAGRPDLGRVLKIENGQAVRELPRILGTALRGGRTGIMIARGDLAVEVGFGQLAEVQEDILSLCEAAHVPAIWATQVLERMAKKGLPSRAELTDAAQGVRAECVMLNKGPFIVETLRFLAGILRRMDSHQTKRRPQTGRLSGSVARIG